MRTQFTDKEQRDAGLALLLLLLLLRMMNLFTFSDVILVFVLLLIILLPRILYPFAFLWYNLADIMGHVVSFIFLNVVYWLLVVPMALIRKIMGKDSLRLRQFKKNTHSVFHERNYTFTANDLTNTF